MSPWFFRDFFPFRPMLAPLQVENHCSTSSHSTSDYTLCVPAEVHPPPFDVFLLPLPPPLICKPAPPSPLPSPSSPPTQKQDKKPASVASNRFLSLSASLSWTLFYSCQLNLCWWLNGLNPTMCLILPFFDKVTSSISLQLIVLSFLIICLAIISLLYRLPFRLA